MARIADWHLRMVSLAAGAAISNTFGAKRVRRCIFGLDDLIAATGTSVVSLCLFLNVFLAPAAPLCNATNIYFYF